MTKQLDSTMPLANDRDFPHKVIDFSPYGF